jgi:hypothetical protein
VLPATLLTARWIETLPARPFWLRWLSWSIAPALAVSMLVALSDYEFANSARTFARTTVRDHLAAGTTVYFSGHWGFQHFMERDGARAFNYREQTLHPGDLIAFPVNNTANDALNVPQSVIANVDDESFPNRYPVHPMSVRSHARFYASLTEPLPFNFPAERYVDRFVIDRYAPELSPNPELKDATVKLQHPQFFKHKRQRLRR